MNNGASGKKPKRYAVEEHAAAGHGGSDRIAADSTLLVSLVVGKRPRADGAFVHDTKKRLRLGHLPAICIDAYAGYESTILASLWTSRSGPPPQPHRPVPSSCPALGPKDWPMGR